MTIRNLLIAIALLISALLFVSYQYLFVVVGLDDARQYEKDQSEQIQLLRSLFLQTNISNMTLSVFSDILREHYDEDYIVKEHFNYIEVGNVVILFKGEKLINISSLNECKSHFKAHHLEPQPVSDSLSIS